MTHADDLRAISRAAKSVAGPTQVARAALIHAAPSALSAFPTAAERPASSRRWSAPPFFEMTGGRSAESNPGEWLKGDFERAGYLFEVGDQEASRREPRNDVTHRFRGQSPDDLLRVLREFETRRAWFGLAA